MIDIPGHQTSAGGTLPADILVSNLRPDLVIVDKKKKTVTVLELTVPAETRIPVSHKLKSEKYQHLVTDIRNYEVKVLPFEVGSHTGHLKTSNRQTLHTLHKFCQKDVKLKKFLQNISAVAVLGSYYIFNCRNEKNWEGSEFILAPFLNQ